MQSCAADLSTKTVPRFSPKRFSVTLVPWIIDLALIRMNHNRRLEKTHVRSRVTFCYPCYSFIIEPDVSAFLVMTGRALRLHISHDHKDSFRTRLGVSRYIGAVSRNFYSRALVLNSLGIEKVTGTVTTFLTSSAWLIDSRPIIRVGK